MALQRIRAGNLEGAAGGRSRLGAEVLHLPAGRLLLNRHTPGVSAIIVGRGRVQVGVVDDDATLGAEDGVVLDAEATYSLRASEASVVTIFALTRTARPGPGGVG